MIRAAENEKKSRRNVWYMKITTKLKSQKNCQRKTSQQVFHSFSQKFSSSDVTSRVKEHCCHQLWLILDDVEKIPFHTKNVRGKRFPREAHAQQRNKQREIRDRSENVKNKTNREKCWEWLGHALSLKFFFKICEKLYFIHDQKFSQLRRVLSEKQKIQEIKFWLNEGKLNCAKKYFEGDCCGTLSESYAINQNKYLIRREDKTLSRSVKSDKSWTIWQTSDTS